MRSIADSLREEGLELGKADVLARLLRRRFGLTKEEEAVVRSCHEAERLDEAGSGEGSDSGVVEVGVAIDAGFLYRPDSFNNSRSAVSDSAVGIGGIFMKKKRPDTSRKAKSRPGTPPASAQPPSPTKAAHPHDRLFKEVFSTTEAQQDLVRGTRVKSWPESPVAGPTSFFP